MLFECLTGAPPYDRASRLETAWAHLEEEPPSAQALVPELPEAIDPVVRTALAKEPDDRYPTCTALISAAEHALGFGRSTPLHRRKSVLLVAAIMLMVLAAASVAAVLATNGHGTAKGATPLFARADSLARIDPATNKVSAVIDVGSHPVVAAAGGHSVWVYNKYSTTISEVDARTNRVLKTTTIAGLTTCPMLQPVHGAAAGRRCVRRMVRQRRRIRRRASAHAPAGRRRYEAGVPARPHADRGCSGRGRRLGGRPPRARPPGAADRSGHRPHDCDDDVPSPLESRLHRLRLRRRMGHELVDRDALPDRSSLGPPDGECRGRQLACHQARDHALRP